MVFFRPHPPPNGTMNSLISSPKPPRPVIRPRSRNRAFGGGVPAVTIKTHEMLNPQERKFLEAAEKGDKPTLLACLNQVG